MSKVVKTMENLIKCQCMKYSTHTFMCDEKHARQFGSNDE